MCSCFIENVKPPSDRREAQRHCDGVRSRARSKTIKARRQPETQTFLELLMHHREMLMQTAERKSSREREGITKTGFKRVA